MNKRLRFSSLLILGIAGYCSSFSQIINIDKTDTDSYVRKGVIKGNVSLGLEVDKQKTTLFDASNFVDASLQKFHEFYILSASNRFTYNGGNDYLNAGYAHLRWRHNYKNKWHPETYLQYQWDHVRGMKYRFVAGENLRYNIWRNKNWEMSVATGLMYENEVWDYIAVDSAKIPAIHPDVRKSYIKSNSYVKWDTKISANSNLSLIVFYQALFDHFFKPRIATNVNFNVAVSKHFSMDAKFVSLYDAAPVVPIFNFYYNFSYGLMYKF